MALLYCVTLKFAEIISWFFADGEIHLFCFLFHLVEGLFVSLAVVLNVALFV